MIVFQASGVFSVFDAFTQRPIPLNLLRVTTEPEQRVLRKPGGYLVLLGSEVPKRMELKCPDYLPLSLDFPEGTPLGQERCLWMVPEQCQRIPLPLSSWAFALGKQGVKLAEPLKSGGNCLSLFPLEGKCYRERWVLLSQGNQQELVFLAEELEPNQFLLAQEVKGSYQKLMAQVFFLYSGVSLGEESFLPLPLGEEFALVDDKGKELTTETLEKATEKARAQRAAQEKALEKERAKERAQAQKEALARKKAQEEARKKAQKEVQAKKKALEEDEKKAQEETQEEPAPKKSKKKAKKTAEPLEDSPLQGEAKPELEAEPPKKSKPKKKAKPKTEPLPEAEVDPLPEAEAEPLPVAEAEPLLETTPETDPIPETERG